LGCEKAVNTTSSTTAIDYWMDSLLAARATLPIPMHFSVVSFVCLSHSCSASTVWQFRCRRNFITPENNSHMQQYGLGLRLSIGLRLRLGLGLGVGLGLGLKLGLGFGLGLRLVTSWEYGGGKYFPGATNFPRHRQAQWHIVLDGGHWPLWEGEIWGLVISLAKTCSCFQFAKKDNLWFCRWQHWSSIPAFTELFWSLFAMQQMIKGC